MHFFKHISISCVVAGLFFQAEVAAQTEGPTLPSLPKDPTVTIGKLPNGMAYYFDLNKSGDGMVSLSLVQKYSTAIPREDLVKMSREQFTQVHVGSTPVEDILAHNNILPGREGFIIAEPGSVEYRFSDISMARSVVAIDSLLLSVFKLAQMSADSGVPTADQAIIMAGDFDKGSMLAKMNLLSLMVGSVPGAVVQPPYVWNPEKNDRLITVTDGNPVAVSVKWYCARMPEKYMNTVLPLISGKMNGELSYILSGRLYPAFKNADIDAVVKYEYMGSDALAGDECSTLNVYCTSEDSARVREIVSTELRRLATYGVDDIEYAYARDSYRFKWLSKAMAADPSDRECVDKCKSAFLYSSCMATDLERMRFIYRDIPDTTQARQFNLWMIPTLLQKTQTDKSLSPVPAMLSRSDIASKVNSYSNSTIVYKAPKDVQEYVGGDLMCTFPNGVNFAYKKMATSGLIYYAYASKGGRQWAKEENLRKIEGTTQREWFSYLSSLGITMVPHMDASNVVIRGTAPKDKLPELMAALAAVSKQEANHQVFGDNCYKILTIVGEQEYAPVKKIVSGYIPALGFGSSWKAIEAYREDAKAMVIPGDVIAKTVSVPLDMSAENYALSEVCRYVLQEELAKEFTGCALSYFQHQSFSGFPTWTYKLSFGVRRCSMDGFALTETYLEDKEIRRRLNNVLRTLSTTEITAENLQICRQMASNSFSVYSKTPEYYLTAICYRYLDNRNIYSRHTSHVARVSASSVKEFFNKAH